MDMGVFNLTQKQKDISLVVGVIIALIIIGVVGRYILNHSYSKETTNNVAGSTEFEKDDGIIVNGKDSDASSVDPKIKAKLDTDKDMSAQGVEQEDMSEETEAEDDADVQTVDNDACIVKQSGDALASLVSTWVTNNGDIVKIVENNGKWSYTAYKIDTGKTYSNKLVCTSKKLKFRTNKKDKEYKEYKIVTLPRSVENKVTGEKSTVFTIENTKGKAIMLTKGE